MTAKPPLEQVQEGEKLLERLMLVLPGFRGYKLREQRREADRIVRGYIYKTLEQSRDDLSKCFQLLADSKAAELLEPMNQLVAVLDRVAEKINHASYGYTGFFDSIKVEEPELDRILAYDTQLLDSARKFGDTVSSLRNELASGTLENARIRRSTIENALRELERAFDQRKQVIEQVKA